MDAPTFLQNIEPFTAETSIPPKQQNPNKYVAENIIYFPPPLPKPPPLLINHQKITAAAKKQDIDS
jgi:hypothetical protein